MKKVSILFIIFFGLMFECSYAQYGKWAFEAEAGTFKIKSAPAPFLGNLTHLGLGLRYNFNPKFGLGVTLGGDIGTVENFYDKTFSYNHYRANFEGYINLINILGLDNKFFSLMVHGGPGVGYISVDSRNECLMNFRSGVTGLFRINNSFAIKADYSTTVHLDQREITCCPDDYEKMIASSTVRNYSVGLVYYFGNKNTKREHADWYKTPKRRPVDSVVYMTPVINNYYKSDSIYVEKPCDVSSSKFRAIVTFDNDSYQIKEASLGQLYDMSLRLKENPGYKLVIKGWASRTSGSDEYNLKLSKKRCQAVYDKYIALGVDPSLIKMEWNGKDQKLQKSEAYDMARRVEVHLEK